MENDVYSGILDKGTTPTREDIAKLLASVGKPGRKRTEKQQIVQRLFEDGGWRPFNFQMQAVWDDLASYSEW